MKAYVSQVNDAIPVTTALSEAEAKGNKAQAHF